MYSFISGHSFCRSCLKGIWKANRAREIGLPCPACRTCTPIPECGLDDLPSDFKAVAIKDILTRENTNNNNAKEPTEKCTVCKATDSKVFCLDCKIKLCMECNDAESHLSKHHLVMSFHAENLCKHHEEPCSYVCRR